MFRVIPVLLIDQGRLVKTRKFSKPKYVGDPMNAVRIFNEKEVDELLLIDISATERGTEPGLELIQDVGSEAFVPFGYGGGVRTFEQARSILRAGAEKVILQESIFTEPGLVCRLVDEFGSQAVVASIDYRKRFWGGNRVHRHRGRKVTEWTPVDFAKHCEKAGVGEIFLTNIDREGTREGIDLAEARSVIESVNIPVVVHGGAKGVDDFKELRTMGASAGAAGTLFVFHGEMDSVLISYLDRMQSNGVWD